MPAKKQRTPQEKKELSYAKDCRNRYMESHKSATRKIRMRKQWVNGTYRTATKNEIRKFIEQNPDTESIERLEDGVQEVKRKNWKKSPDTPLGEVLQRRNA